MSLFKRKPKPPLEETIRRAEDAMAAAMEAAFRLVPDRKHMPTGEELALLDRLAEALWKNHAMAQGIARNMRQRARGEPEGPKKFTDPEVFDYHYPP